METKELNLCEILKDCPKGTKLYSTVYGEVAFEGISSFKNDVYPISISRDGAVYSITSDGRCINFPDTECCLFPSKYNRDWSTFKPKKEHFDPKTLKPFDRVLVRDYDEDEWRVDIFDSIRSGMRKDSIRCIGRTWHMAVPYNDDTKHLVGTTDDAPGYYCYWK